MKIKNILSGFILSLITIASFFLVAEAATRMLWDAGYRHKYDWRDRTEGYAFKKEPGVFRILLLGDSLTYGQGVQREETFAKLLEGKLNSSGKRDGDNRYEVINLGWPGMNTADEYVVLAEKGFRYEPDLVVVAYYLNDVETAQEHRVDVENPTYIRRPQNRRGQAGWEYAIPIPAGIDQFMTVNSDLYVFLLQRYDSLLLQWGLRKRGGDGKDSLKESYRKENVRWLHTQYALSRIASFCRDRTVKIGLVILPTFYNLDLYPYEQIHELVKSSATEREFPVLDLLPAFAGKASKEYIVSRIDTHPNEKAHRIMADALYRFILKEGLVH